MRTAQEFQDAAEARGITRWTLHRCSFCDGPVSYYFRPHGVGFDAGCDCSSGSGWTDRSWQDVADHYNLQNHPDVIAEYDDFWGFQPLQPILPPVKEL